MSEVEGMTLTLTRFSKFLTYGILRPRGTISGPEGKSHWKESR